MFECRAHIGNRFVYAAVAITLWWGSAWWGSGLVSADDGIESTSVIPIRESSAQQVGSRLEVKTLTSGTSSRRQRKVAIDSFPFELMDRDSQQVAHEILDELSLYRHLPEFELDADRRCYEFFTNHPDVAVSIWRAMDISQVQMSRESASRFQTDTQDGTSGIVQVLLNSPQHYIVTCHGEFKSPAIQAPIQAVAMMHLRPQFRDAHTVTHQLDLYVSFPSHAVEAIARLISPISNRIADRNFEEISLFVEMMSLAMARQPGWVEKLTKNMEGVRPQDVDALLELTATMYVEAVKEERRARGLPVTIDDVTVPVQFTTATTAEVVATEGGLP